MKQQIRGLAYVLGDNVDTDQIIPAQYLTLNPAIPEEYKLFGKYALIGVPDAKSGLPRGNVKFVEGEATASKYKIIVAGKNFGCGSSREHAPIALNAAGVEAVVAEFYARIFFRNAVNGGYLIPLESRERLIEQVETGQEIVIDLAKGMLTNLSTGKTHALKPLGEVAPIIEAGGVFEYAKRAGMLK